MKKRNLSTIWIGAAWNSISKFSFSWEIIEIRQCCFVTCSSAFCHCQSFCEEVHIIGIILVFSCINICRGQRRLFEHKAARMSVQTSSEGPSKMLMQWNKRVVVILHITWFQSKISLKTPESHWNSHISYVKSWCTKWCQLAKLNVISTNDVNVNKSTDKMLIPGRKVLLRSVMQTNLHLSWGFSSKNHIKTAREFHDQYYFERGFCCLSTASGRFDNGLKQLCAYVFMQE